MATKANSKKVKKTVDNKKANEIHYLKILLKYSIRNVLGQSPALDSLFVEQVGRIQKKIDKLEQ